MKEKIDKMSLEVNILFNDSRSVKMNKDNIKQVQKLIETLKKESTQNNNGRFFIEIADDAVWSNSMTNLNTATKDIEAFCKSISSVLNIKVMVDIYDTSKRKGQMIRYKNGHQESVTNY